MSASGLSRALPLALVAALTIGGGVWFIAMRDTPARAAEELVNAMVKLDGSKMSELSCEARQNEIQAAGGLASGLLLFTGLSGLTSGSTSDMSFATIREVGDDADVRVTGKLRMSLLGFSQTQNIDATLQMKRERGRWRYCGDASTPSGRAVAPATPTTNALPTVAVDQPDPNGELVTDMGSEPDTIDPQKESVSNEVEVTMKVFEALMTFDVKTGRPIPAAAKDQPQVSADGTRYTYTLRDGLRYSDGTPVTAADFKYGWERLCDPATAGAYAFTGYIVEGCEAWNGMDPQRSDPLKLAAARQAFLNSISTSGNTISFKLTAPAPYFNSIAGLWVGVPVRRDAVAGGGDKWTEPATFIGNGPFVLSQWRHGERMVFTRSPFYRNPTRLAKWTQVMIGGGAVAFAAYRNNELDVYDAAAEDLRTISGDADLRAQVGDGAGSCTRYIGFNNRKAPFTDRNVRLALAKAFDRTSFVRDIVGGLGKPATSFIPPGIPGFDPDDTFQKFDAAAARAALSQASPSAQAALRSLKITYSSSARNKTRIEWFQQQWKVNLGVDVALDPVDSTTFTQLVKKQETLPVMFLQGWCADYYDQQNWLTTVFSSKASSSRHGYNSKTFDDLVFAADRESDLAKRDQLYLQASRLLSQDAAAAFIYYDSPKVLQKPWVKNYYLTGIGIESALFTDVYVTRKR